VLKKTCVTSGLIIAAAAGTLLTSSPASAQAMDGWGGGKFRHSFRFWSGHRNWNGNENEARNRIRIRIRNRNNNVAVARNEQAQRERQFQREFQRDNLQPRRLLEEE
jgi:hypothetical protein